MGRRTSSGLGMAEQNPLERERRSIATLLQAWPPGQIEEVIQRHLQLWQAQDLASKLRWCWNPRLRTTIGRALLEEGVLELNPLLLGRHPEEMEPVVVHELAHLVITARYGLSAPPHGEAWKALMRQAGHSTKATHNLNVDGLRRPKRRRRRRRTRVFLRRWR